MPLVQCMIFLHTTDMARLISNNKLLSFLVIKFTSLFVLFLTLNMKSPCYPGKGQHRNAVSTEILMVHAVIVYGATFLLQCCIGFPVTLQYSECWSISISFHFSSLLIFLHGNLATNLYGFIPLTVQTVFPTEYFIDKCVEYKGDLAKP